MKPWKIGTVKILILILLLTSCVTRYINPPLPNFSPTRPTRPTLEEVENVPEGAIVNTEKLMGYAKELEAYADSWENYYRRILEYGQD